MCLNLFILKGSCWVEVLIFFLRFYVVRFYINLVVDFMLCIVFFLKFLGVWLVENMIYGGLKLRFVNWLKGVRLWVGCVDGEVGVRGEVVDIYFIGWGIIYVLKGLKGRLWWVFFGW